MVLEIFCHSCVACALSIKISRPLPDRQVQSFNERGVELRGVLRPVKGFLELPAGADDPIPINLDNTVLAPRLHHNAIHTAIAKDLADHPSIVLEAIGGDQRRCRELAPAGHIIQEPFRIGVASSSHDGRGPQSGADLQGHKDPHRPVFAPCKGTDFFGL